MKEKLALAFYGCLSILVLDLLGSIASRYFQFYYENLWPLSFCIYALFSFIATRRFNLGVGVLIAALIGLIDSTIGWKISIVLNAYGMHEAIAGHTPATFIATVFSVVVLSSLIGLIAGAISKIRFKT